MPNYVFSQYEGNECRCCARYDTETQGVQKVTSDSTLLSYLLLWQRHPQEEKGIADKPIISPFYRQKDWTPVSSRSNKHEYSTAIHTKWEAEIILLRISLNVYYRKMFQIKVVHLTVPII
jgi:hypothetical protein